MAKQTVALYTVTSGDRVSRARDSLAEALGGAQLGEPDDAGGFEVAVDAESPEEARALVREAFAKAGTGDDFVIQETTEGREIPPADPRQAGDEAAPTTAVGATDEDDGSAAAPAGEGDDADGSSSSGDRASLVADAASAVAAAASSAASGDTDAAREAAGRAADAARTVAGEAAESVREAASAARSAVDEKGVGAAASDYASAAQGRDWSRFAPIGAGIFLLLVLRRMRR